MKIDRQRPRESDCHSEQHAFHRDADRAFSAPCFSSSRWLFSRALRSPWFMKQTRLNYDTKSLKTYLTSRLKRSSFLMRFPLR